MKLTFCLLTIWGENAVLPQVEDIKIGLARSLEWERPLYVGVT